MTHPKFQRNLARREPLLHVLPPKKQPASQQNIPGKRYRVLDQTDRTRVRTRSNRGSYHKQTRTPCGTVSGLQGDADVFDSNRDNNTQQSDRVASLGAWFRRFTLWVKP